MATDNTITPDERAELQGALLASVRQTLVEKGVAASAPEIEAAVNAGVPWQRVVTVVAEGVVSQMPPTARPGIGSQLRWWECSPFRFGLWALVGVLGLEAGFALGALLLRTISAFGPWAAETLHFADPIYTGAAFETLGYIQPIGIAMGERWPLKVALAPGAGALASLLAATLANALVLGLALRKGGLEGRVLATVVAAHLVMAPPSSWDLDASGLSFAVGVLAPELTGRSLALSDFLAHVPATVLAALLAALAGVCCAAPSLLVARRVPTGWTKLLAGMAVGAAAIATIGQGGWAGAPSWIANGSSQVESMASLPGLLPTHEPGAAERAAASSEALRSTETNDSALEPAEGIEAAAIAAPRVAPPTPAPTPIPIPTPLPSPSRVQAITHSLAESHFEYRVNGKREVIRGMGYNARYSALSREERQRRIEHDFSRMSALGVNTVQGWSTRLFDDVLLNAAAKYGLGVILPFELDPKLNYADRDVQAQTMARIEDWVRRYRDYPSLRMWGLGNEVLHKMVRPTWLGGMNDAPEKQARARAFSDFLLRAADRVWQLDKNHPLAYREAEQGFLVWLREAMERRGGMPENMVIGTNAYTRALKETVEGWPDLWMMAPLYVSEFGAAGRAPGERAAALKQMWRTVRSRPQWTLGGVVYVWTTDGPEEVDRTFGLVDTNGAPVGEALAAVAEMFKADAPQ